MWGYGPGMMGYGGGTMGLGFIFWIVLLGLVAYAVLSMGRPGDRGGHEARRPPALDVLEERYARGEIGRDEYLEKRRDLTGEPAPKK